MPAYKFLFTKQEIDKRYGPSPDALELPEHCRPPPGYEVVPTDRAIALAGYMLSLSQDYEFPETRAAQVGAGAGPDVPQGPMSGEQVYATKCTLCHQANGEGLAGTFPPLAGSKWLSGNPERAINIVLSGLVGPITVKGTGFNGAMIAHGPMLSNKEIAGVLTFVRSQWGNSDAEVTEEAVATERPPATE